MPRPTSSTLAQKWPQPVRIGFLALTDAAPLVAACRHGFFAKHGVRVELHREVGWATIREKILYDELDAAPVPAPMLWSACLGIDCAPCEVLTALVLNLHGNALTLSRALLPAEAREPLNLPALARNRVGQPFTFGVVSLFSSHHLMLRNWLQKNGLHPERDVRIFVVPPAQMFRNLAAGTIDGYCAGEPWNSLAVQQGVGWCPTWSAAQQPGHLEKVLMVRQRFAHVRAAEHAALVAALVEACAWCDEPQNRAPLAQLLAEETHLDLPARVIAPALIGRFDCGDGRVESAPDFHIFHRGGANAPAAAKAAELQAELMSADLLSAAAADLPRRLFREDIYRDALATHHAQETITSSDARAAS